MLSLFSSGQEILLHKTHAERVNYLSKNFYDNPIHSDSNRFFVKVNNLKKLALKQNDRELYLETIFLRLNFLSSRNYKNYLPEAHDLLKIADKEALVYLQIRIRQAIGFHYYYETGNYGEALFWFLNSAEYLSKITESEFPEKQEALSNIANICYTMKYPYKALKYLKMAEKYNYKYTNTLLLNILNTEALAYRKLKDDKKAEQIFKKLFSDAHQSNSEIWKLIAATNLAELYIDRKFYQKAVLTLSQEFAVDSLQFTSETLKRKILLAECYLAQNKMDLFQVKNDQIAQINEQVESLQLAKRIAYLNFKYHEHLKNFKLAILFADSTMQIQSKINSNEQQSSIKLAVDRDAYLKLLQKQQDLKENKIRTRQKIFFITLTTILILFIGFILFRKEFRKQKRSIQTKDEQLSKNEIELQAAKKYLDNFTAESIRKDKLISQIVQKASTAENELAKRSIYTDVDWIEFKIEFSTVYPLFFEQLKIVNPQITPALERIAALISLGLENTEMATLLGISTESVTRSKRRLKEKLPDAKDHLEIYLKELTVYNSNSISNNLKEKI